MTTNIAGFLVPAAVALIVAAPACAQTLARQIDGAATPIVSFHFAARAGTCGDGRTYIRTDGDAWYGSVNDAVRMSPCQPGPVRVVVVRSDREPIRLETFVGPLASEAGATDLGSVGAAEASAWLLSLASSGEGRVARDALLPASLADSASVTAPLLAIVRDQGRSRELRRSAMGWLVRRQGATDAPATGEVVRTLATLARDEREQTSTREYALGVLSRFARGEGAPTLITLSGTSEDPWLARKATEVMGRSGDPRARRAVRALVEGEATLPDVRVAAMSTLVGEYGTAADAELVRKAYPRQTSDRARDAALSAAASLGGANTRAWLVSITKDRDHPVRQRRKAAELLDRAGASTGEVVRVYDEVDEPEVRTALIAVLARSGTREATEKLLAIARSDPVIALRRRAVSALGRVEDPRVRDALADIVQKP